MHSSRSSVLVSVRPAVTWAVGVWGALGCGDQQDVLGNGLWTWWTFTEPDLVLLSCPALWSLDAQGAPHESSQQKPNCYYCISHLAQCLQLREFGLKHTACFCMHLALAEHVSSDSELFEMSCVACKLKPADSTTVFLWPDHMEVSFFFFLPDLFKVSVHHWWILSAATTAKHGLLRARYVWLTVLSFCANFNACWPPQGVILFYSFFLVMATLQLPATNLANLANLPPGTKLYLTTNSKNPSGKGKLLLIPQGAILRATNNAS